MVIDNREESRRFFVQAWRKYRDDEPLEPLERVLAEIILRHPEYHAELDNAEDAVAADICRRRVSAIRFCIWECTQPFTNR